MAAVVGGTAIGIYELCLLAAAALATYFVATPQGQKATQEAAQKAAEALEKLRPKPDPEKEPKPPPIPPLVCPCPDKKEKCPVCGILANPTPGKTPPYVLDNRVPMDHETLPPLTSYKRTERVEKQARVWRRPDDTYVHRDTKRQGKAAELENYNKREKHTGTTCPHCGAPRGSAVPGRTLPD